MGLFVDNIILKIVREVRREHRRKEALRWNVADGKVMRFTTTGGFGVFTCPILGYSYRVNGEDYTGSATGVSIRDSEINSIGDGVDALTSVRVRYNPEDPRENRLLDEDNPRLPFEIDLMEH